MPVNDGNGYGMPNPRRPNNGDGYGAGALHWVFFEGRKVFVIKSGFGAGHLGESTGDGRAPTEDWPSSE